MPLSPDEIAVLREDMDMAAFYGLGDEPHAQCRIYRHVVDTGNVDQTTLELDRGLQETAYEGPCVLFASTRTYEQAQEYAEAEQMSRTYNLRVPWTADDIRVSDRVEITQSEDPFLADKTLTVIDPQGSTSVAIRQIVCELNLGHY